MKLLGSLTAAKAPKLACALLLLAVAHGNPGDARVSTKGLMIQAKGGPRHKALGDANAQLVAQLTSVHKSAHNDHCASFSKSVLAKAQEASLAAKLAAEENTSLMVSIHTMP